MKNTISRAILVLGLLTQSLFAEDVIEGPEEIDWGTQVVLKGETETDVCGWILVNPPKDTPTPFISFDGKSVVFSTKYPGKYYFVFSYIEKVGDGQIDFTHLKQVRHCLIVKGGDFVPDPDPLPDDKLPDGKYKLAEFAKKSAENPEILPVEQLENVDIVASVYGEVAILAETSPTDFKPGEDLSLAVVERMKSRLGMESFEQWKKFGMTIAKHVQQDLKLKTLEEEIAAWKEVSIGLRSLVKKDTVRSIVPQKLEVKHINTKFGGVDGLDLAKTYKTSDRFKCTDGKIRELSEIIALGLKIE